MTTRRPSLLPKIRLEYALPLDELDLDVDSPQVQEMGDELKKFYFGFSALNMETVLVYLMVILKHSTIVCAVGYGKLAFA